MNKKILGILSVVLIAFLPQSLDFNKSNSILHASNNKSNGISFENEFDRYSLARITNRTIRTYEAWVDTYETGVNQGSTIFANYSEEWLPGISFRIYTFNSKIGQPQLNFRYGKPNVDDNNQKQFTIPVNICGTGRRHVAFTVSSTQINGYLDGVLKKTWDFDGAIPSIDIPYSVGGDERPSNTWWFRGSIYNLALYSSVRSASQIANDMNNVVTKTSDLIAGWNFSISMANVANDGNELMRHFYSKDFIDSKSYDYSMAVIGDTQSLLYYYPDKFSKVYDCLLEKKDELKIELIMGLGDIVEKNLDAEWKLAREEIFRLSGEIPYTIVRGNHDLADYGGLDDNWRLVKFGQYFNNDTYRKELTGLYNNSPENAYKCINICGVDYLIMTLDYGANDDVLSWANHIASSYPSYNIIVTTHAFLFRDGTTLDESDLVPPSKKFGYNNGDDIWDKFISKHSNIKLVLSGHDPHPEIVRSEFVGDNGNVVNCLLIDPQYIDKYYGPYGMIAFLHFSNNGQDVSVEYYSSITGEFFKPINQFSFCLDNMVDKNSESFSFTGGYFKQISELSKNDLIAMSSTDGYLTLTNNNFKLSNDVANESLLVLEVMEEINGYSLKTQSNKYLYIVGNNISIFDEKSIFEIYNIGNNGFSFKHNDKYLSLSNGDLILSNNPYSFGLCKYVLLYDDPLDGALRYIDKFNNSFVCGFDSYTPANSFVFETLEDDYNRLAITQKQAIFELIVSNDSRVDEFVRKYNKIMLLHYGEEGFNNFLNIEIPKNNKIIYNDFDSSISVCYFVASAVFISILGTFVLVKNRKKR